MDGFTTYGFFTPESCYGETVGWYWHNIDKDYGKVTFPNTVTEDAVIDFLCNSGHITEKDRTGVYIDWRTDMVDPFIEIVDKTSGRTLFAFSSRYEGL